MSAYYNEIDEYAAQWLRNLIARGHIAPGIVDTRSIEDVRPDDLFEFTQCHFFAGIGVWSYALRLAGWPDAKPVWTGSCPCQPFSAAGKQAGIEDKRHLWPVWSALIKERRPPEIFGEQVAAAIGHAWLDTLQADLETQGYAVGAAVLGAHSVGAPHIRQRLYFVANNNTGLGGWGGVPERSTELLAGASGLAGKLADAECERVWARQPGGFGSPAREVQGVGEERKRVWTDSCSVPDSERTDASPTNGFWRDADWLFCRDGKWRPVEPGTFPLAHGAPARVGRLRAYGNAINAETAKEFIAAYLRCRP